MAEIKETLDSMLCQIREAGESQVGYPANQRIDYSPLFSFLDYSVNNIGDPFHDSNYRANTHEFEREVIAYVARLMHIPPEEAWVYVTSGGTEGNMYGL